VDMMRYLKAINTKAILKSKYSAPKQQIYLPLLKHAVIKAAKNYICLSTFPFMAYIQNIPLLLFLLAGFSCLQISLTEGRQLKPFKKQEKHDFPANASLQIVGQKRNPPPTNQKHEVDSSDAMGVNDFRPTSPGKSPGIGHSFPAQKDNVAGKTDDFRPTGPGHSPGIGHSFANKTTGPNA
ncbi:Hypothetical predicted protein, partial [Olea europaea subsp. europaea]